MSAQAVHLDRLLNCVTHAQAVHSCVIAHAALLRLCQKSGSRSKQLTSSCVGPCRTHGSGALPSTQAPALDWSPAAAAWASGLLATGVERLPASLRCLACSAACSLLCWLALSCTKVTRPSATVAFSGASVRPVDTSCHIDGRKCASQSAKTMHQIGKQLPSHQRHKQSPALPNPTKGLLPV